MTYFDSKELAKIDTLVREVENESRNNDELVKRLAEFSLKMTGDSFELRRADPFSPRYAAMIADVHTEIIGKMHRPELEGLPLLNLEYEAQWPYPWGTKCSETVGRVLSAYGFLIKSLDLPPNARILEVGCGMGSLTWNLARMGFRVDALDPNENQCQSVRNFTKDLPARPNVVAMTLEQWLAEKPLTYKYDSVIFFESFHHVMKHKWCLERLLEQHLELDGKVFLAAEPVFDQLCEILPYPWGPRLDGESLRAMRKWGWLELGFTADYILELLKRLGMKPTWLKSDVALPHSQLIRSTRIAPEFNGSPTLTYRATLADGIDFSKAGLPDFIKTYSGLADGEPWGRWSIGSEVRLLFNTKLPANFDLTLNLRDVFGPNVGKTLKVQVGSREFSVVLDPIEVRSSYGFRFIANDSQQIRILVPHPFRPKDMPELNNEDSRRLGIAFKNITIKALG